MQYPHRHKTYLFQASCQIANLLPGYDDIAQELDVNLMTNLLSIYSLKIRTNHV